MALKWNFEEGHMFQLQRVKSKKGPKMHPKTHPKKGPKIKMPLWEKLDRTSVTLTTHT